MLIVTPSMQTISAQFSPLWLFVCLARSTTQSPCMRQKNIRYENPCFITTISIAEEKQKKTHNKSVLLSFTPSIGKKRRFLRTRIFLINWIDVIYFCVYTMRREKKNNTAHCTYQDQKQHRKRSTLNTQ